MQEIWKDIPNYEGLYQISNLGNVKSLKNKKETILHSSPTNCGYYKVQLYKNGGNKMLYVHRLVATAFIENAENKSQINHIDGNKSNNNSSNLEWCTPSENQLHAIKNNLRKPSNMLGKKGKLSPVCKRLFQYDLNGNFIKEWWGVGETAHSLGIGNNTLIKAIKEEKPIKNTIFKYANF